MLNDFINSYKTIRKADSSISSLYKENLRNESKLRNTEKKYLKLENKLIKKDKKFEKNISTIVHEIRTPLNGIKGFTQLSKKEGLSKEKKEMYSKLIDNSVNVANDIVGMLYVLGGIDKGESRKNFKLEDTIKRHISITKDKIEEENIKTNLEMNYSKEIYSIEGKFDLLIGTLYGNSLKFALPKTEIDVSAKQADNNLEIIMKNKTNGKQLREMGSGLGKGLGTQIAKNIVEDLGGELYFKISKNGSINHEVKIILPLENLIKKE
jgi:signal transduction histidine kinase